MSKHDEKFSEELKPLRDDLQAHSEDSGQRPGLPS
jgi:hypothetical protein